ncbi:biopolymer transporter ExbD [bacterium]|nr:biopolymer transporter ExbD [bacterium]
MGAPRRRKTRLQLTDLDFEIVPLVDMIILLLMFVVVTTSFRGQPGIKVDLPASAATPADIPQYTEVSIAADGKMYLGHEEIEDISALGAVLQERAAASPSKILFVRADRSTRHGLVVAVIDVAKRAGFLEATIATVSAQE